jgi:IS605 OrfB family transposase
MKINASADVRERLWATHRAFNAGVAAAIDALLTIRAGLSARHALERAEPETAMRLLPHWWLTIESKAGAPATYALAVKPTRERVAEILHADGIDDAVTKQWLELIEPSLHAPIRDDAVWVDRRAAFDALKPTIPQDGILDVIGGLGLLDGAFEPLEIADDSNTTRSRSSKLAHLAGQYLSLRLGRGVGRDFTMLSDLYENIAKILDGSDLAGHDAIIAQLTTALGVDPRIAMNGHRSATYHLLQGKPGLNLATLEASKVAAAAAKDAMRAKERPAKGARPWSDFLAASIANAFGLAYAEDGRRAYHGEYCVILDHALRRISANHNWLRHAQQKRLTFTASINNTPPEVIHLLDDYCTRRAAAAGYDEPLRIRERTIGGWDAIVHLWASCPDATSRQDAVARLQADPTIERFGDQRLFNDLADESMTPIWIDAHGKPNPDILRSYVHFKDVSQVGKIPALRHPNAITSPSWIDFGLSRWSLRNLEDGCMEIGLIDASATAITPARIRAVSKRHERQLRRPAMRQDGIRVSRADRLGMLAGRADAATALVATASSRIDNLQLMCDRNDLERLAAGKTQRLTWYGITIADIEALPIDPRIAQIYAKRRKETKTFGDLARPRLNGIPRLRVLGVDVGLRSVATYALLETLAPGEIEGLARQAGVTPPTDDVNAWTLQLNGKRTTFRRTGDPAAPWARVERTWVVRLPGERSRALAAPSEIALVYEISSRLRSGVDEDAARNQRVLTLQNTALRIIEDAVRRNDRLARIAATLMHPDIDPRSRTSDPDGADARVFATLERWRGRLQRAYGFVPSAELTLYRKHIGRLNDQIDPNRINAANAPQLGEKVARVWLDDRESVRKALRALRILLLGKAKDTLPNNKMGGLSLERIERLNRWYRILKAHLGAPTPENPRGNPTHAKACASILKKIERLSNERLNVVATRIVAAALGEGPNGSTHAPASVIVMENLATLRTSQRQSRNVNRLITYMRPATLQREIEDRCKLAGISIERIPAAYTTLIGGFSGEPGITAAHVRPDVFLFSAAWRKRRDWAHSHRDDPEAAYLLLAERQWNEKTSRWTIPGGRSWKWNGETWDGPTGGPPALLLPRELGPLFIDRRGTEVDADQSAAITIGLFPLLNPGWEGAWPMVPCKADGTPNPARTKGGPIDQKTVLLPTQPRPTNAWRTRNGSWSTTTQYWKAIREEVLASLSRRLGVV